MAAEQGISLINIVPSIAVHDHIDLGQYMKVIVGFLSPDVFFDQLAFIHENVMSRASRCLQYLIHVGERLDQEPSRTGSRVHESFTVLRVGGFHDVVDQLTGREVLVEFSSQRRFEENFVHGSFDVVSRAEEGEWFQTVHDFQ